MTEKLVRAYRGAITVDRDEETLVVEATQALLTEMLSRNTFDLDDVISVFSPRLPTSRVLSPPSPPAASVLPISRSCVPVR